MKKVSFASLLCALVVVVVLAEAQVTEGVTCNPYQLQACMKAFTSSQRPTPGCCAKLGEQKPCLCGYMKNPALKQYVTSPNARSVLSTCRVPPPRCY